jgi:hypothetical protein
MPVFTIGTPVETETPGVVVEFSDQNPLMPGKHIFELEVQDNDGLTSTALLDVVVVDERGPTAVLDGPSKVPYGQEFKLRGDRSSDPFPGKIVKYTWTLME